jgi:glycosyltransferase involved in cell wall biosynthesis
MVELTVVMPVYNEDGAIASVLAQWVEALQALSVDYQIVAYNDGSRDGTMSALQTIAQGNRRIMVIDKPNSGHGPTILQGYRRHLASPWIFQVDSDGELGPDKFVELWENRECYDFLIGNRVSRKSPLARQITTWISRYLVWTLYGRAIFDVNCPYRLFRPAGLQKYLLKIPPDTFAPNLLLAGIVSHLRLRVYQTDVVHTNRQTGVVSIKRWKLFKAALASCLQTIKYRLTVSQS